MQKIWLKSYPEGVPAEIDVSVYKSVADIFERSCKKHHDKIAYSNLGVSLTYGDLEIEARKFATFLQQVLRMQKGDRIAVMLPNILQYPVAMFGALLAGLTVVNVNPLYTPPELAHQLKDSGAEAIVVLVNFASVLEQALPQTKIKHVIITEVGDLLGPVKSTLVNLAVKYLKRGVPAWHIAGAFDFRAALAQGEKLTFKPVNVEGEDVAFLQYTGGTTGVAKGAILTHKNMVSNVLQCYAWVSSIAVEGKEVVIVALPMYHIFSLTICCLCFLDLGCHGILITNPRDIVNFIKILKKVPFSVFVGVNTLFNALLNRPEFQQLDFTALRLSIAGGMALQHAVVDKWKQVTGNWILEGYGLTEAAPVVTINSPTINGYTGSIGLPIPSTNIKICDDEGNELPLGEAGELYVQGPQVMRGYWKKEVETKNVLTADGWLKTGDIMRIDERGYVFMVDRKKDLIIVSGFNVYPNEVEDVIASHPGVLEVGVVGVDSEHSGETVKAFIVKKDPHLTEQDILDFCHERLTRYKVPKIIEFTTALPKSNVGKILRRKLKEM